MACVSRFERIYETGFGVRRSAFCRVLLFHDEATLHDGEMTGEGADVGIGSGAGSGELDLYGVAGVGKPGRGEDSV